MRELEFQSSRIDLDQITQEIKQYKIDEMKCPLTNFKIVHQYYLNIQTINSNTNKPKILNTFFHLLPKTLDENILNSNKYFKKVEVSNYDCDNCYSCKSPIIEDNGIFICSVSGIINQTLVNSLPSGSVQNVVQSVYTK